MDDSLRCRRPSCSLRTQLEAVVIVTLSVIVVWLSFIIYSLQQICETDSFITKVFKAFRGQYDKTWI